MVNVLAIIDCETGGLEHQKHALIEVSYSLVQVPTGEFIRGGSLLVNDTDREYGAFDTHGIPEALVREFGQHPDSVLQGLARTTGHVSAICGHNAPDFDRAWLPGVGDTKPWLDTQDFPWPRKSKSMALTNIAIVHGVAVDGAHRASEDVRTTVRLIQRALELGASLEAMIAHASRPKALFEAVSHGYDEKANDVYRAHHFRFNRPAKRWERKYFVDDVGQLPFAVREV